MVQTITSSVDFVTGSTRFGSILGNTHVFSGSVTMNPGGLFVSSSGNVGIGTTAPSASLHALGAIRSQDSRGGALPAVEISGGNISLYPYVSVDLNNPLTFIVGGSYRMFISSSGNVGIGTTTPATKFDLSGSIGNFQIASSGAEVFFTRNENNDILATGGTSSGITLGAQSYIKFSVGTSYTERMRITSGGNVGIGTTDPNDKLTIWTPSTTGMQTALRLNNPFGFTNANTGAKIVFSQDRSTAENLPMGEIGVGQETGGTSASGYIFFSTISSTMGERMRITSNGNVGIGTTSTNYKLQVNGRISCGTIVQGNFVAGNISGNLNAVVSPNFILLFDMTNNPAGWSLAGTVNAAAWDCWNISTVWIRKLNGGFTANAGITGLYKSGCDFAICDITYSGTRYLAMRFTANPEIDVMWTGYGLTSMFNSDGSVQIVYSGVTVNSTLASY